MHYRRALTKEWCPIILECDATGKVFRTIYPWDPTFHEIYGVIL